MKIAITGHTDGIGKWIYDNYSSVIGFSRSNGYDITNDSDRTRIVNCIADCDVFINNACDESEKSGQAYMLRDIYRAWRNTNKHIVTVGSRIVNDDFLLPEDYLNLFNYRLRKLATKDMHTHLVSYDASVHLHYVSFGYVGTPKILEKYPNFKYPEDYITMQEAADLILEPVYQSSS